jgi:hypothetical protein
MFRFPLIVRSCGAAPGTIGGPLWVTKLLDRFGLTNLATVQQKLADRGSLFLASQAIIIGQTTFEVIIKLFVMPYLLFFLLRDGEAAPGRADLLIPGSPSGAFVGGLDGAPVPAARGGRRFGLGACCYLFPGDGRRFLGLRAHTAEGFLTLPKVRPT